MNTKEMRDNKYSRYWSHYMISVELSLIQQMLKGVEIQRGLINILYIRTNLLLTACTDTGLRARSECNIKTTFKRSTLALLLLVNQFIYKRCVLYWFSYISLELRACTTQTSNLNNVWNHCSLMNVRNLIRFVFFDINLNPNSLCPYV